jgi:hypothetical protein
MKFRAQNERGRVPSPRMNAFDYVMDEKNGKGIFFSGISAEFIFIKKSNYAIASMPLSRPRNVEKGSDRAYYALYR